MDDTPRRPHVSFLHKGLYLLAVFPVLLSLWGTTRFVEARPVVGERTPATLTFFQHAVNLGEVPAVGTIPASFFFENQSNRPVRITALEPSCGCLTPQLRNEKKEYSPGEQGQFTVAVHTANEKPGPKNYAVTVKYDDGAPREAVVRFRLAVPERKVTVQPSEVYFYQLTGQPDARDIQIEDHRGTRLNVRQAFIDSDQIQVSVGDGKVLPNGVWSTSISLNAPAVVRPGREIAILKVQTDDPEYGLIQVPVLIQGRPEGIQQTAASVL
ncbi:MAG: DUF1573 domain-containing protein, partial [Planctomycetaceae bacterium]|nr:DUF1573 domain-containing protein [Planctomycetaceae bacterium]